MRSYIVPVLGTLVAAALFGTGVYSVATRQHAQDTSEQQVNDAAAINAAVAANTAATPTPNAPRYSDTGPDLSPPVDRFRIVNGHDHMRSLADVERYLPAAAALGVVKTLFVASSEATIKGTGGDKEKDNDVNAREVLACAAKYPDKVIPFVTLTPKTPDKIALLESYVQQGAKGLKLYTGHGDFHDLPLDTPEMLPVYEWLEKNQFPIVWHVNLNNFSEELTRVLAKYPKLRVMIPHFGVGFFDTKGKILDRLGEILDTYPNVYVDSSFGTRAILVSGLERVSTAPGVFRAFYEKYQDRIIFGTDMVVTGNKEKTTEWMAAVIRACRDMHEKSDYIYWMAAKGNPYADKNSNNPYGHLRGLALPDPILKKIYETNVENFLGAK